MTGIIIASIGGVVSGLIVGVLGTIAVYRFREGLRILDEEYRRRENRERAARGEAMIFEFPNQCKY